MCTKVVKLGGPTGACQGRPGPRISLSKPCGFLGEGRGWGRMGGLVVVVVVQETLNFKISKYPFK